MKFVRPGKITKGFKGYISRSFKQKALLHIHTQEFIFVCLFDQTVFMGRLKDLKFINNGLVGTRLKCPYISVRKLWIFP